MTQGRRKGGLNGLALREQEILNILYMHESCSANQILEYLDDNLNNATIRTILRTLESKGFVKHIKKGKQFIYSPIVDKKDAANGLFDKMVKTFFYGSVTDAVATFIDSKSMQMSDKELDKLMGLIQESKKKNK